MTLDSRLYAVPVLHFTLYSLLLYTHVHVRMYMYVSFIHFSFTTCSFRFQLSTLYSLFRDIAAYGVSTELDKLHIHVEGLLDC